VRSDLTSIQARIVATVRDRSDRGLPPPTYRDLCAEFGWSSTGTARDHLRALERKGYIELPGGRRHRQIRLKGAPRGVSVPVLGRVAAGRPVSVEQSQEGDMVSVPDEWLGHGSHFALQVSGESMVGAGILEGDHVIVREETTGDDGDVVAATIDGETTLKRLRRRGRRYALVAENPRFPDIEISTEAAAIHGVVVGLMRAFGSRRTRRGATSRGKAILRNGT